MSRVQGAKNYYTFIRGLVSEASALTFPENASLAENNFVLNLDGSRNRRLGLKSEGTTFSPDVNYYSSAYTFNTYKWRNPGGAPFNFAVVKLGRYINFFTDDDTYSDGLQSTLALDLNTYKLSAATTANIEQSPVDMAFGKGKLIIVGKYFDPLLVTYNSATNVVSVVALTLVERDLEGLNDGLAIDFRPASPITAEHEYNLRNQGWTLGNIATWDAARADLPANTDIMSLGYDTARAWTVARVLTYDTNTPAPKGHFTRQVFNTNQVTNFNVRLVNTYINTVSGTVFIRTNGNHNLVAGDVVTLSNTWAATGGGNYATIDGTYTVFAIQNPTDYSLTFTPPLVYYADQTTPPENPGTTTQVKSFTNGTVESYRPTATAFFAGRAWYSGIESNRIGDFVYYTQVIEFDDQFAKVYQVADPTAENDSALVATDGDSIKIPGLGVVRKMVPVGASLLVLSSNGVWAIGPGSSGGFTADSFTVRQLSTFGCSSKESVVLVENTPIFWSESGIYTLAEDKISGFLTGQNLTVSTIQTFYNDLSNDAISSAKGVYNDLRKTVTWMYKDDNGVYSKMLLLEVPLSAFHPWSLSIPAGGDTVPVAVDAVTGFADSDKKVKVLYKTVVAGAAVYNWGDFTDTDFEDFGSEDAAAYLDTGYEIVDDARKNKQTGYVFVFMEKTETGYDVNAEPVGASSLLLQGRWNWSNHANSGKFTTAKEVYRHRRYYVPSGPSDPFESGETVVVTRNRVPGSGNALSLRWDTTPGKNAHLLGWAIDYGAGSAV